MEKIKRQSIDIVDRMASRATKWIGSTNSLLVHTALFMFAFVMYFWGIKLDKILLVVTTIVSLEAIYLSIFIQMSVNRQARKLYAVARDVEEIQEDVEDIQEDVEEIQEDVEDIQEEHEEEEVKEKTEDVTLTHIQILLSQLAQDVKELKDKHK